MDVKRILEDALINKSELAKRLWPDQKNPKTHLYHKMKGINGHRITELDAERIREVIKKLCE